MTKPDFSAQFQGPVLVGATAEDVAKLKFRLALHPDSDALHLKLHQARGERDASFRANVAMCHVMASFHSQRRRQSGLT